MWLIIGTDSCSYEGCEIQESQVEEKGKWVA